MFVVRCTSELLVKPSWGRIQQWVPAVSANACAFQLSHILIGNGFSMPEIGDAMHSHRLPMVFTQK